MKVISIILFSILLSLATSHAKARYAGKKDMIQEAECIAIVSITKVEKEDKKGTGWTYRQKASATVQQCLKGDAKGEITLYGLEDFICAQCKFAKGRFIVFLRKDGALWVGSNWQLGIRPIREGKVQWFKDDQSLFEMEDVPLDQVIAQIGTTVNEQRPTPKSGR